MMRYAFTVVVAALGFTIQHCEASSAPLSATADGHLSIPVMLDGQGPFDLTLDTAAQGPMVSPKLAEELKIVVTDSAEVHGSSGNGIADFTEIGHFRSSLFDRNNETAVIAPPGSVVSVGVVG